MFLKKTIPAVICFLGGVFFVALSFVPEGNPTRQEITTEINDWFVIIGGFSIVIALVSLFRVHWTNVARQYPGWFYSLVLLIALVSTFIVGVTTFDTTAGRSSQLDYIYQYVIQPLDSTVFALLGFYIVSAAYSGFRIKNFGSVILLAGCVLVMIGLIPIGVYLYNKLPDVGVWLLATPNNAAKRALIFTIAIASVAYSLKVILGIDKSIYGGTRD